MTTAVDVGALEARYEEAIRQLPPKTDKLRDYLVRRTLESRKARVVAIREVLAIEKFELVFIGKIATGKTTAICNLVNLTNEVERGKPPQKKTEPLLTTGTGRSTICKVEVVHSEQTMIEIDPLSPAEMRDLLADFGDSIFARIHPERYEKSTDGLTIEIERAIRNVVGLSKILREGKEVDPALELARQMGDGAALVEDLLKRADLDSRKESRAIFQTGDERAWLQDTFKKLNVGRCAGFSIPKCIRVLLGPSLTKDGHPGFISRIWDTKGLDEILVRTDIDEHIERSESLCLFTSSFAGAPDSEVINYVERHLQDTTSGFEHRCILLVLPRNGEAANLLGPDGNPVEQEELGEAVKADQARLAFQNRGINFLPDNIVFYDAMQGYERGLLRREDEAVEGRRAFFDRIERIIDNRRARLHEATVRLDEELTTLLGGSFALQPQDHSIVAEAQALLRQSSIDVHAEDFVYSLMHFLKRQRRAIQFHALNRRFGVHGEANLFELARAHVHNLVRHATQHEFNRVATCAAGIRGRSSSDLAPFLTEIEQQFKALYETYLKNAALKVRDLMKGLLEPFDLSNEFWQVAISEWGKGPGYWDRESNDYERGLEGIAEQVMKMANEDWKTEITEPLARFLVDD